MPEWADAAVADYARRFPSPWRLSLIEIKTEVRSASRTAELCRNAEAVKLKAALPPRARVVAMDERGQDWTTEQFASKLGLWREAAVSDPVVFLIGGPDGLEPALRESAHHTLRLSSMTLPHALARVVLAEQLYRAWSVLTHHPYHRAG